MNSDDVTATTIMNAIVFIVIILFIASYVLVPKRGSEVVEIKEPVKGALDKYVVYLPIGYYHDVDLFIVTIGGNTGDMEVGGTYEVIFTAYRWAPFRWDVKWTSAYEGGGLIAPWGST